MFVLVFPLFVFVLVGYLVYRYIKHLDRKQAAAQITPEDAARQERFEQIQNQVRSFLRTQHRLAQPGVDLNLTDDISTDLLESRLGGHPAWPKGKDRPMA